MDDNGKKILYLVIIIFIAATGIISMILMMIKYKKTFSSIQKIRKRIIFQLNISCILHCLSHFLLINNLSEEEVLCQIEGSMTFTFLLSTLLFTVQISFFSYHSQQEGCLNDNNRNKINIIFSIFAWAISLYLCIICFFCSKNRMPFTLDKNSSDYNCSLDDDNNTSLKIIEYIYISLLIAGLFTNLIYTILMIVRDYSIKNGKRGKNKRKFISCSLNIITYLPTIIQHCIDLKGTSIPFGCILLIDLLECLSGIIYVIAFEYENVNLYQKESYNTMEKMGSIPSRALIE